MQLWFVENIEAPKTNKCDIDSRYINDEKDNKSLKHLPQIQRAYCQANHILHK